MTRSIRSNPAYIHVRWESLNRKAQCEPDEHYPDGIEIDATTERDRFACRVDIPYPPPHPGQCGLWAVDCDHCQSTFICTAAGRPDDPKSMTVPCRAAARSAEN